MPYNRKIKKVELSPKLKLGVGRGLSSVNILKISGTIFLVIAFILILNSTLLVLTKSRSSIASKQAQPQVLGASDAVPATNQQPDNNFIVYKVVSGDTVFSIAQKYGISWSTIATLNNLNTPFILKIGQELKVPKQ